jgi:hypothetical protein
LIVARYIFYLRITQGKAVEFITHKLMTYVTGIYLCNCTGLPEQAGYNGEVNVFNELGKIRIAVCAPFRD